MVPPETLPDPKKSAKLGVGPIFEVGGLNYARRSVFLTFFSIVKSVLGPGRLI